MTDDPNNASRQLSENIGTETRAQSVAAETTVTAKDAGRLGDAELARLTDEIIAALKTVYDPEIPADIYELGLIYRIDIADDRAVNIDMTLTTPNCPSAQEIPSMVENAVTSVPGVREAKVEIVWDPPWDPSRMSDEARAVLNMW
jgi:FeS assembly SUF system protein